MEIKNESKFLRVFRRYGVLALACVMCVVIALVVGLTATLGKSKQVSNEALKFLVPMQNAVVIKDYADDHLQHNESLKRWEIHLAVDLTSDNVNVFSVADGTVTSATFDNIDGGVITISHADGFVSIYSSLESGFDVREGSKVSAGQKIGTMSSSASNESKMGGHLHFTLLKDGVEVDPNNYIDLQNK